MSIKVGDSGKNILFNVEVLDNDLKNWLGPSQNLLSMQMNLLLLIGTSCHLIDRLRFCPILYIINKSYTVSSFESIKIWNIGHN